MPTDDDLRALSLLLDWGADEALGDAPVARWRAESAQIPAPVLVPRPSAAAAVGPPDLAGITTVDELYDAWAAFPGCALRTTATNTVRPSGAGARQVLMLADAPSADDDRSGHAFSGPAGATLDRMIASAGLSRADLTMAHLIPWRPPGNRPASDAELRICLPFVYRLLQLLAPRRVVLMGQSAIRILLSSEERLSRLRGRWQDLSVPPPAKTMSAMVMAPAENWLRTPSAKRDTWNDLLLLRSDLNLISLDFDASNLSS